MFAPASRPGKTCQYRAGDQLSRGARSTTRLNLDHPPENQ